MSDCITSSLDGATSSPPSRNRPVWLLFRVGTVCASPLAQSQGFGNLYDTRLEAIRGKVPCRQLNVAACPSPGQKCDPIQYSVRLRACWKCDEQGRMNKPQSLTQSSYRELLGPTSRCLRLSNYCSSQSFQLEFTFPEFWLKSTRLALQSHNVT